MDTASRLALAKLISEKDTKLARAALTAGTHSVDMTIRVTGVLEVSADYFKAPTTSIPLKETLAFMLKHMGLGKEQAKKLLVLAMEDAIKETSKAEGSILEAYPEIEDAMKDVAEITKSLPKVSCKGPVKPNLTVVEVAPKLVIKDGGAFATFEMASS
jgi:leucyl aminopeptidase (aminopeptidase T)